MYEIINSKNEIVATFDDIKAARKYISGTSLVIRYTEKAIKRDFCVA